MTDADDTVGLLTFETKMSWGVVVWHHRHFVVRRDLGESDRKVRHDIETMIELAPRV